MRRLSAVSILVTLALLPLSSQAAPAPDAADSALLLALGSVCEVPTADELLALHPDAPARLYEIALDEHQNAYIRLRAVSLLSMFPDDRSEGWLATLMEVGDARQRGMAVYTFARTFGPLTPERVASEVAVFLDDSDETVRSWAARGLRWVPGDAARRALTIRLAREPVSLVRETIADALQRPALPLSPDRTNHR